jgi:hypothetical protein
MFKRNKKKTGVQTPELRKPTPPPPPPTSGSNAVKPNPNYVPPASVAKAHPIVCAMNLEDLDDWVKTRAQIGDVAYCHDSMSDHHYIYRYHKPDDDPVWSMINPDFLEKYSKKENEGDNKMNITGICPYETPCGYCSKWDKKCNKKIGPERGQRVNINPIDDAIDEPIGIIVNKICKSESDHEWECVGMSTGGSTYRCRKCYAHKTIPLKTGILETYIGD